MNGACDKCTLSELLCECGDEVTPQKPLICARCKKPTNDIRPHIEGVGVCFDCGMDMMNPKKLQEPKRLESAEERAEKIAQGYAPCMSQDNVKHLAKLIAAEIKDACAEAVEKALRSTCYWCSEKNPKSNDGHLCPHLEKARAEGFAQGLEEAAKILDDWGCLGEACCEDSVRTCCEAVAEQIRARAKDVK